MADLFISYSRKDKTFVQRLQPALEAEGQSLWVDWKDIPLTADWRAEIRQGIQEADAVIFVISPDFLNSQECRVELETAQELNKRLVPLVYREVKAEAVSPALTSLNWIFFRENDDFDSALQSLIQALGTDLAWVKAHTRLTIRAAEWESKARNYSFLLRGDDLRAAELLLGQTMRQPELAPLQIEYILASRQNADRRQRRRLAAVTFGFIVALVLGVVAYRESLIAKSERDRASEARDRALAAEIVAEDRRDAAQTAEAEAKTQRDIAEVAQETAVAGEQMALNARATAEARRLQAERTARIALSGQLAAQAQAALLENRPQRGLILAAEAIRTSGELRLPNTETILWQILANAGGRHLDDYEDTITSIVISPDSRWLVIASPSSVQAWDLNNLEDGATPLPLQENNVSAMAISPDNRWLVIASGSATQMWELADLAATPVPLDNSQAAITALAISPDSRQLATGSITGVLQLRELADLDKEPVTLSFQESQKSLQTITFSPDNRWLVTVGNAETNARLWNLSDLEAEADVISGSVTSPVSGLAFSPDSRWLALSSDDTYLWDLNGLDSPDNPRRLASQSFVRAMTISPDGRWLVTGNANNLLHLWNLANPAAEPEILYGHDQEITAVAISADNRWLVSGSLDHTSRIWDLTNLKAELTLLRGHDGAVRALAVSPNRRWLVTGSADQTTRLWDLASPNSEAVAPIVLSDPDGFNFVAAVLSPNGGELITANDNGAIQVRDLSQADGWASAAPPLLLNLQSGHQGIIKSLALSPDGRWLASHSDEPTARLWELRQMSPEAEPSPFVLEGHSGAVTALAFSSDGRWLATGSDDTTIRLWELAHVTDKPPTSIELTGHKGLISALAVSADNYWLVSAGSDGTVRLWNLAHVTDKPPTSIELTGHEAQVKFAAISADNRWLVTADDYGQARLWPLSRIGAQALVDSPALSTASGGSEQAQAAPILEATILPTPPGSLITALSFSPDSRWLAIAGVDGVTYLWKLENIFIPAVPSLEGGGRTMADDPLSLRGHTGSVLDIAIDPESRWLVTGSYDGTARLWDLGAPDPAAASVLLPAEVGLISGVEISPDTHWLVTRSDDGVALWTLSLDEQFALACGTAGRNLTLEEWEQYFSGMPYRNICD